MDAAGNVTTYEYDPYTGQLKKTTLPETKDGQTSTINYSHDGQDRLQEVTQGDRSVTYGYGEFDDLTSITHNGFSYGYTYDVFGNVLSASLAGQVICTYEYAPYNGSLAKTTLADDTTVCASYDAYGRIISESRNGRVINRYLYDNDGNVARKTDAAGSRTTTYDYNDAGLVVRSEVYHGGDTHSENLESRIQYTYTKSGKIGTLSYREKDSGVKTYTYTYAADELPVKNTYPDKSSTDFTYDTLRRTTRTVYTPKSGAAASKKLYTTYTYQAVAHTIDGKKRTTTTGLVSQYTNRFGSTGTIASQFNYTYDTRGNITGITDQTGKKRTYTYNEFGEITQASETYADGTTHNYAYKYDAGGNIKEETIDGTTHKYDYDNQWKDQLTSYDDRKIIYDEMGRPTDYMGAAMTWDESGNLTSVTEPGETASPISYTYLSDGRRRTKTVNGVTTTYHYNNGMLLSEITGDETMYYYYDSAGKVAGIGYRKGSDTETGYFFTRNAQGDINGFHP